MKLRPQMRNVAAIARDLMLVRRATRRFLRRSAAEELFYGTEVLCRLAADIGDLPPDAPSHGDDGRAPPLHGQRPLDD